MTIYHGKVVGRFLGVVEDGLDLDSDPDLVPLSGTVTFTPSVTKVLAVNEDPPVSLFPLPIKASLDSSGYLTHNFQRGIKLISNVGDLNPSGWTWTVSFDLRQGSTRISAGSFPIEVAPYTPGEESTAVDLALASPVETSRGETIVRGEDGKSVESVSITSDGKALLFEIGTDTQQVSLPDFDAIARSAVASETNIDILVDEKLTNEISGRQLVESSDPRLPISAYSDDRVLVETDEQGRVSRFVDTAGRTWIKLHPSAEVPGTAATVDAYGSLYSIVDSQGRLAFEITSTGEVRIPRLGSDSVNYVKNEVASSLVSGPDIVCWGDSMTAGAGGNGTSYPSVLGSLSGRTVHNRGVGGETSVTIAARASAQPMVVMPSGNTIPASGSVELTIFPVDGYSPSPLKQGLASNWGDVSVAGVRGSITRNSATEVYSFNRLQPGDPVPVTVPVAVVNNDAVARRGDIHIIWIGQNGPSKERAMSDANAIIQEMTAHEKRYLVMSKPTSTDAEDAEWRSKYGRRFISPRRHLVDYGLQEAGIAPTAQDITDISNGTVPTSLRVDGVHFNAAGYTVLANHIYARLREFRWI